MNMEGLILAIVLLLGGLAILGPMGSGMRLPTAEQPVNVDNREISAARNRYARIRFSRNWPQRRRSQFL
jgi:hypothetical protein